MRYRRVLPLIALVLGLVAACSAEQEIVLEPDGAGRATIEIRLDPVFTAYLSDVNAGLGGAEEASLFDLEAIRAAFAERPGLELVTADIPERSELRLTVDFDSVERIVALQGHGLTRFLRFERTESFRRVAAEIDRKAIEHLTVLTGIDPLVVESLMPPEADMTRLEYQDHLGWALEEYTRERPLELVFRESQVVTDLTTSGEVVRMDGGIMKDGGVEFTTSLVDAVITRTPLQYSVVYLP